MKKFIPDCITSMNLLCGIIGVVFAFKGRLDIAFLFMLGGAVFDFFDGFAARALGAYSDMGKELDSLSDDVTFGVLPSVMLYKLMCNCTVSDAWYCYIPLLIAVFSGLRLAKFNVDERQHASFIGMPTPACAMLCGALCCFVQATPDGFLARICAIPAVIPAMSLILCYLLVCELPMFSFKFKKDDPSSLKGARIVLASIAAVTAAAVLVLGLDWSLIFFLIVAAYILENVILAAVNR